MRTLLSIVAVLIIASPLLAGDNREAALMDRGVTYYSAGDYERAARSFEEALRLGPGNADGYTWAGKCYFKLGNNEAMTNPEVLGKAVQALRNAVRIAPDSAEAHYYLGLTQLALQSREEAMKEQELLVDIDKELANTLLHLIHDSKAPTRYEMVGERAAPLTKVRIRGNQVLVPVRLEAAHRTVDVMLLLDTGASESTITPEIAEQLDIDPASGQRIVKQVAGGGLLLARRARIDYMTVGPTTKKNVTVAIIRQNGPPVQFDGLLGMNFLRGLQYHIDFDHQFIDWKQ
jgi:tetratricopeptide (TPR) repeat protein